MRLKLVELPARRACLLRWADGRELILPKLVVRKLGLKPGSPLDPDKDYSHLVRTCVEVGLSYSLGLLSRRDWYRKELEERLRERGYLPEAIGEIVSELARRGYLSDEALARSQVERLVEQGYGPHYIRSRLLSRGAPRVAVEEVLAELSEPIRQQLSKVARDLYRKLRPRLSGEELSSRLLRRLLSRGFELDWVREVVTELCD